MAYWTLILYKIEGKKLKEEKENPSISKIVEDFDSNYIPKVNKPLSKLGNGK